MFINIIAKAYAAVGTGVGIPDPSNPGANAKVTGFGSYLNAMIRWGLVMGYTLGALMIIYAGFKYAFSQGNQTQINDAKDVMISAAIGIVILVLIGFILKFLGINLK